MARMTPDWVLQLVWFAAGVGATGAFWYFLSQKNYGATLWTGCGALVFALLAVALHVRNDLIRRRETVSGRGSANAVQQGETAATEERATPESGNGADVREAQLAAADPQYSPMTMEEFFEAWYRKATTSLQRDELERQMVNRRIIWNGKIKKITRERKNTICVTVEPVNDSYGTAFLDFDQTQRSELLKLHENQEIRFTGVIRDFLASPFLADCKIMRVLR